FSAMWSLSSPRGEMDAKTPGRVTGFTFGSSGPAVPQTTYSAWLVNPPSRGRAADVLSQTPMPRQTQPPDWKASVVIGSCRQSVKSAATAPGLAARSAAFIQSDTHARYE